MELKPSNVLDRILPAFRRRPRYEGASIDVGIDLAVTSNFENTTLGFFSDFVDVVVTVVVVIDVVLVAVVLVVDIVVAYLDCFRLGDFFNDDGGR